MVTLNLVENYYIKFQIPKIIHKIIHKYFYILQNLQKFLVTHCSAIAHTFDSFSPDIWSIRRWSGNLLTCRLISPRFCSGILHTRLYYFLLKSLLVVLCRDSGNGGKKKEVSTESTHLFWEKKLIF